MRPSNTSRQEVEHDYELFTVLVDMWSKENSIKTDKLQMLLVVNGLLATAIQLGGGITKTNWPMYTAGAILCLVWLLSIGRTVLYQKFWRAKIETLRKKYRDDDRFQIFDKKDMTQIGLLYRIIGGVSSKTYLLGAPIFFGLVWIGLLVWACT